MQPSPTPGLCVLHPYQYALQLGALLTQFQSHRAEKSPRGAVLDAEQRVPSADRPTDAKPDPRGRSGGPDWSHSSRPPSTSARPTAAAAARRFRGLQGPASPPQPPRPQPAAPPPIRGGHPAPCRGTVRAPERTQPPTQPAPPSPQPGPRQPVPGLPRVPPAAPSPPPPPSSPSARPPEPVSGAPQLRGRTQRGGPLLRRAAGVHVGEGAQQTPTGLHQGRGHPPQAEEEDPEEPGLRAVLPVQAGAAEARAGEREDTADEPGGAAEGGDQPAGEREGRLQTQV